MTPTLKLQSILLAAFLFLLATQRVRADDSNYGDVTAEAEQYKNDMLAKMQAEAGESSQGHQKELKSVDDMVLFFQMHDHNKDGHLDGHELSEFEWADQGKNILDATEHRRWRTSPNAPFLTVYASQELKVGPDGRPVHANSHITRIGELRKLVDTVLDMDDTDNDGMISWEEYYSSQKYHHQL